MSSENEIISTASQQTAATAAPSQEQVRLVDAVIHDQNVALNVIVGFIWQDNKILGKHEGLFNYTIGQRKGIGIGGIKNHEDKPWFVLDKDMKSNSLIISQQEDKLLYKGKIELRDINWVNNSPNFNTIYKAKFRHGGKLIPVKILLNNNECTLIMKDEERAVTLGQSAVLYSDNECIGGGIIKKLC